MGSDLCSAPATSVDAERAFSAGRRQVNFLQHNKSSQTFKAQMALGSWARSPLYPGIESVSQMVQGRMGREDDDFFVS
ncbi:hypothetical protein CPB83DRAFT_777341 [Crepidotus variabilis]|uniref:HAT C-terminal dimerisation domain-containing protein n=1 Tax=Crepidotus variabilis TaxID=179855 RepID=A0A9P6JIQ0_9AGAR|nr:hypothetical protein CPB83DRAFT_777341 [Crepidotus variabilis]